METSEWERTSLEAALIWAVGNKAGFGHPFSKLIRVEALEDPFISSLECNWLVPSPSTYLVLGGEDWGRRMTKI